MLLPWYMEDLWQIFFDVAVEELQKVLDPALFDTDPATCPEAYLPYLAEECGAEITGLDGDAARRAIADAVAASSMGGTIGSLARRLAAYGGVHIAEWMDTGSQPYTFRLHVDVGEMGLSDAILAAVERTALEAKNVRSRMESIGIYLTSVCRADASVAMESGEMVALYPYIAPGVSVSAAASFGAGVYGIETISVLPKGG